MKWADIKKAVDELIEKQKYTGDNSWAIQLTGTTEKQYKKALAYYNKKTLQNNIKYLGMKQ